MTRAGDREKTRVALLAAAREVIAEAGMSGASVEAISRRAGVTKGAFYYAFANKAALLTELGRASSVTILGHGADLLRVDAEQAATALLEAVHTSREQLLFQVELWLYASRNEDVRQQLKQALIGFTGPLEQALDDAHVAEAATAALATRSLLIGLVLHMVIDDSLSVERIADVLGRQLRIFDAAP
jgi:AcrR family transcriptional regulator